MMTSHRTGCNGSTPSDVSYVTRINHDSDFFVAGTVFGDVVARIVAGAVFGEFGH